MNIFYGLPSKSVDTFILKKYHLKRDDSGNIIPGISDDEVEDYNGNIIKKESTSIEANELIFDEVIFTNI